MTKIKEKELREKLKKYKMEFNLTINPDIIDINEAEQIVICLSQTENNFWGEGLF